MKQSFHRLLLPVIGLALVACSPVASAPIQTSLPTMLPTANQPEVIPGVWAISFEYPFPENFWNVGIHRYRFYIDCPLLSQDSYTGEMQRFIVSEEMPVHESPVYLRLRGLSFGPLAPLSTITISPTQSTIAVVTFLGITEEDAKLSQASSDCEVLIHWDGVSTQALSPGEPFQP
ncbi:MAG: hypothetical protein JSV37_04440 [Anaerolineaceae bacterium]|nr:MAG: hypothetical protein JSV37_04440 [Anaerolineaceae bacterium]